MKREVLTVNKIQGLNNHVNSKNWSCHNIMTQPATKELCFLCFEALENKVLRQNSTKVSSRVVQKTDIAYPMFVTWKIGDNLRGCIGNFRPLPLYSGLQEYAVISGMEDPRFSPISSKEIPKLNVGISLLHTFEKGANCLDWEVGKHGIDITIDGYSATFLPEVATEQHWDKEETLRNLLRKAGFRGKLDKSVMDRIKLERYQSSKCKATYDEYKAFIANL